MTTCSTTVEYAYDHLNRMTKRGSEYYIHDGYQIVLTLNASTVAQSRFFWGASQDELIAEDTGSLLWTLCDHLGSVRDVVNNSGTSLNHLEYNAFGKLINKSSTSNVPTFRYTGKMTDDTSDLQWNINRWYDAGVGRWVIEDPIGFDADDANLVRYVGNTPIQKTDIEGFIQWDTAGFPGQLFYPYGQQNPILGNYMSVLTDDGAKTHMVQLQKPKNEWFSIRNHG